MAEGKGIPLQGDRSSWDDIDYSTKHAKSIEDGSYEHHTPLSKYDATSAPGVTADSDAGYAVGSRWVDVTNDKAYICLDDTVGAAVWLLVGDGNSFPALDDLTDVNVPAPVDGDVLTWNELAEEWMAADSSNSLDDLTDVNAPLPDGGDVLTWDAVAEEWIPEAPPSGGADVLNDLTDVSVPAPDDGDVLTWDSVLQEWIAEAPPGGGGAGDMTKAVYDTDDDGAVDKADAVDGVAAAGNSKYYGTDGTGTPGFHSLPAGGVVDAEDVTYTPTVLTDWNGDADPGDLDNALDQLAERVDDLEGAGAAAFIDLTDTPSVYTGQAGKYVKVNPTEDGLLFTDPPAEGGAEWFVELAQYILFESLPSVNFIESAVEV